jgi:hypothetical protein
MNIGFLVTALVLVGIAVVAGTLSWRSYHRGRKTEALYLRVAAIVTVGVVLVLMTVNRFSD